MRIFISCVSNEFRSYREELRQALSTPDRDVKIQEDFCDRGGVLIEKLDAYIQRCQAVIHLVGDAAGQGPKAAAVRWLLNNYPDLPTDLPELAADLVPETCPFTYTQWECFLARYHRVPCYIYIADAGSRREDGWSATAPEVAAQQTHIRRLRSLGLESPHIGFIDARDIAIRFLNSFSSTGGQASARPGTTTVPLHWPQVPAESPYALADREEEFRLFRALLSGQSKARALLLHGPSDRGKSVLLAAFDDLARSLPGLGVALCELKTGLRLDTVLAHARRDLQALRFPRFDRELGLDRPRTETLQAVFLTDLQESSEPVLLLIDTYEQATEEAKRWIEDQLLPLCRQTAGLRLVITGQQVPEPGPLLANLTLRRELPPIREPEPWCIYFREVLKGDSVPDDHLHTLVRATLGNPRGTNQLLMTLAAAHP